MLPCAIKYKERIKRNIFLHHFLPPSPKLHIEKLGRRFFCSFGSAHTALSLFLKMMGDDKTLLWKTSAQQKCRPTMNPFSLNIYYAPPQRGNCRLNHIINTKIRNKTKKKRHTWESDKDLFGGGVAGPFILPEKQAFFFTPLHYSSPFP